MRQIALLASDSSHLPLLSGVTQKYGFEIELDVVGRAKAPTMAQRTCLIFAGKIDFVSLRQLRLVLLVDGKDELDKGSQHGSGGSTWTMGPSPI